MLSFRKPRLYAPRRHGSIRDGNVIASPLFLGNHIYAEVVRLKRNVFSGHTGGKLLRFFPAHVINSHPLGGNSDRQGNRHGNGSFHSKLLAVIPKFHVVKLIIALHDGKRLHKRFPFTSILERFHLKFGILGKTSVFSRHRHMMLGIGQRFRSVVLNKEPRYKKQRYYQGYGERKKKSVFCPLLPHRSTVTPVFRHISNRDMMERGMFTRVHDRIPRISQMAVVIAVDLCLQKQRRNMIVRSARTLRNQFAQTDFRTVHIACFKHGINNIEFFFEKRLHDTVSVAILKNIFQAIRQFQKQIDIFLMSLTVSKLIGQLRGVKMFAADGNHRLFSALRKLPEPPPFIMNPFGFQGVTIGTDHDHNPCRRQRVIYIRLVVVPLNIDQ